jgi:hypothetical protein
VDYAGVSGRLVFASGDTRILLDDKDLSSILGQLISDGCPYNPGPYDRGFDSFHWFRLFSTFVPNLLKALVSIPQAECQYPPFD